MIVLEGARFKSEWFKEKSLPISWQFSKANSLSIKEEMPHLLMVIHDCNIIKIIIVTSFRPRFRFKVLNLCKILGQEGEDVAVSDNYMLQVHGRTPLTTCASQVALKAASLNTNDCFVMVSD